MGIDMSKVWVTPVTASFAVIGRDNAAERRRLLDQFNADQLAAVKRLLEADDRDREMALAVIDDRLARK